MMEFKKGHLLGSVLQSGIGLHKLTLIEDRGPE